MNFLTIRDAGERRFVLECVVADAATIEPVCASKFPDMREKTGIFDVSCLGQRRGVRSFEYDQ
jgi:hypothetical protein